jgi:predicted PurR-regulated permease PerM
MRPHIPRRKLPALKPDNPPPGAPVLESHLAPQLKAVLLAAALVVGALLFQALLKLILLVFMTVLIAIPLAAAAHRLARWRVPRPVGALVGVALVIGAFAAIVRLLVPPLVRELRTLAKDAPATLDTLQSQYLRLVGGHAPAAGEQVQRVVGRIADAPLTVIQPVVSVGIGVAGAIFTVVLVFLTAYYVAVRPEPLLDGALRLFPPPRRPWAQHVMARLRTAWVGWLQGVVADMLITGLLTYIGLSLIGLDFALVFAVFSALLVVIPYFGSIIGGIPPVLLGLTHSPARALLVLGVYVIVQQVEGNVIIPLVMAQRVRLHPAVIAVGVVAVGALFGVIGLFVAVPILSTAQILVDELWVRPAERAEARRIGLGVRGPPEAPSQATGGDGGRAPEPGAATLERPTETRPTPGEDPASA